MALRVQPEKRKREKKTSIGTNFYFLYMLKEPSNQMYMCVFHILHSTDGKTEFMCDLIKWQKASERERASGIRRRTDKKKEEAQKLGHRRRNETVMDGVIV